MWIPVIHHLADHTVNAVNLTVMLFVHVWIFALVLHQIVDLNVSLIPIVDQIKLASIKSVKIRVLACVGLMRNAKLSIIIQFVVASVDILVIHS